MTRSDQHRSPIAALRAVAGLVAVAVIWSTPVMMGAGDPASPIARALAFLAAEQVRQPLDVVVNGARVVDFPGDWPQHFTLQRAEWFRIRDVSPFTVAFIHHALAVVNEDNRKALDVSSAGLDLARGMRRRSVAFMRRFAATSGAPDEGTFGFWPYDVDPNTPDPLVTFLLTAFFGGPILGGQRTPINLPIFPATLAIPSDADVTATTYASLLDDARLDGGSPHSGDVARVFVDWRDLGLVPRRTNPWWLPAASGTFLTWLTYRDQPSPLFPNDVDLVVNGNVLYALGRHRRLAAPGAAEAVATINLVTALGLHRQGLEGISEYYPDNLAFQYVVSRAYYEGPVPGLAPAVAVLAHDLEDTVRYRGDGTVYWDQGDPHLNTAFAVLTLLNAGRHSALVDGAVDYLRSAQDVRGGFGEATFFFGRTDNGLVFEFASEAFTTAMALEAFARDRIEHCGRGATRAGVARQRECGPRTKN